MQRLFLALLCVGLVSLGMAAAAAQQPASVVPVNLRLSAVVGTTHAEALLDPEAITWQHVAARRVALNRTPPLYDTDPPAGLEIPVLEVRVARSEGKLLVHLSWRDATRDAARLPSVPDTPPETRNLKAPTPATERFFDAVAVMFPTSRTPTPATPSLQMGDPNQWVTIHYWNAARGPVLMEAHGRSTTRRTGENFPARGVYGGGVWRVVLELPDLPAGVPLSFAVWNGSQLDRDGRKYFSVWHWLE